MAGIEDIKNLYIRLIHRQQPLANLKQIKLTAGEFGYANDSTVKRVYVGDNTTLGGNPVSTLYQGEFSFSGNTPTLPAGKNIEVNDILFDSTNQVLKVFKGVNGYIPISDISKVTPAVLANAIAAAKTDILSNIGTNYYNKTEADARFAPISGIPSSAIANIQLDSRLKGYYLNKTYNGSGSYEQVDNNVNLLRDTYLKTWRSVDTVTGSGGTFPRTWFDATNLNCFGPLVLKYSPIINHNTAVAASNANQLNAEGYRYIRSGNPTNTTGANGDVWLIV